MVLKSKKRSKKAPEPCAGSPRSGEAEYRIKKRGTKGREMNTVAVVGLGPRGFYTYAQYQKIHPERMKVVAIADIDEAKLRLAAEDLHVPPEGCFKSAEELLSKEKLADVLIVATQDQQHIAHAMAGLRRGYDLILEKPIATTPEDCLAIRDEAKRLHRKVAVCYVLRYTTFYRTIKSIIRSGKIGEVVNVDAVENVGYWHHAHSFVRGNWSNFERSSPMILQKSCHDLDILNYLIGAHCGSLASFGSLSYFNAAHLYEGLAEQLLGTDDVMAFDWETFVANPADLHIEAIDWDTGETVSWTKKDMPDVRAMGLRVRASSTMPLFMPPTRVDGRVYMDGGMGSSWGICLEAARRDGYEKFFIVRTRPRGYRKKPLGAGAKALMKAAFRKHPVIAERTIERWQPYNELCDEIEQLEKSGSAYVFYPETMEVSNKETDRAKLEASFLRGLAQAQREADAGEEVLR